MIFIRGVGYNVPLEVEAYVNELERTINSFQKIDLEIDEEELD